MHHGEYNPNDDIYASDQQVQDLVNIGKEVTYTHGEFSMGGTFYGFVQNADGTYADVPLLDRNGPIQPGASPTAPRFRMVVDGLSVLMVDPSAHYILSATPHSRVTFTYSETFYDVKDKKIQPWGMGVLVCRQGTNLGEADLITNIEGDEEDMPLSQVWRDGELTEMRSKECETLQQILQLIMTGTFRSCHSEKEGRIYRLHRFK